MPLFIPLVLENMDTGVFHQVHDRPAFHNRLIAFLLLRRNGFVRLPVKLEGSLEKMRRYLQRVHPNVIDLTLNG